MLSCFAGPRQQRKLILLKIKSLCATFVDPMARMTGEKHKSNCLHRSSTKSIDPFRVIHRLRFRGLLFSMSDKGKRDTKQVVENLMRLRNITSGVMCVKETRATLTIWNCFKSGCGASVQEKKQNSFIVSWYYSEKKIKLTENRKPRKEQWHLKRCVRNRTFKSRDTHVAYKFPKITALKSSILTSPKREIDRALVTYDMLALICSDSSSRFTQQRLFMRVSGFG